jgi:hypothetical protein
MQQDTYMACCRCSVSLELVWVLYGNTPTMENDPGGRWMLGTDKVGQISFIDLLKTTDNMPNSDGQRLQAHW